MADWEREVTGHARDTNHSDREKRTRVDRHRTCGYTSVNGPRNEQLYKTRRTQKRALSPVVSIDDRMRRPMTVSVPSASWSAIRPAKLGIELRTPEPRPALPQVGVQKTTTTQVRNLSITRTTTRVKDVRQKDIAQHGRREPRVRKRDELESFGDPTRKAFS